MRPNTTNDEAELSRDDLLTLVTISRELHDDVDLAGILQKILAQACTLTDSPDSSIILVQEDRPEQLYFAAATGDNGPMLLEQYGEFSDEHMPLRSIAGSVYQTGELVVTKRATANPDHYKGVDRDTKRTSEAMICAPLRTPDGPLGAIQLLNKRGGDYSSRDEAIVRHLSDLAAAAIRNARLVQSLVFHMGFYAAPTLLADPYAVVRQISQPARMEKLSVMFPDMRGFTELCQVVEDPGATQKYLNDFIGLMAEEVIRHNGIVNKFLGDGLLAVFRGEDHAENAVRSAFSFVHRFEGLKDSWNQSSNVALDFLDVGVGIATDRMIIGSLGTPKVRDFSVFGTAVNLAAAFERDARGGRRILVDQLTFSAVESHVGEYDGPTKYILKKPGQSVGHPYKQYHLKSLTGAPGVGYAHVFLSHNSKEKPLVREVAKALKEAGISVWLDEWDLVPGRMWVQALEEIVRKATAAAVLVGENGLGPWEVPEMNVCLSEFVKRRMPVIPVLLPGAAQKPELPLFLQQFTWVDLTHGITAEGIARLSWGVTGKKPGE